MTRWVKILAGQAWCPKFDPRKPHKGRRKESTLRSCPLASTCTPWHMQTPLPDTHVHTCAHTCMYTCTHVCTHACAHTLLLLLLLIVILKRILISGTLGHQVTRRITVWEDVNGYDCPLEILRDSKLWIP